MNPGAGDTAGPEFASNPAGRGSATFLSALDNREEKD
jgi:hypothetical protein